MKNGFKSVGKAAVYYATYLLVQVLTSTVYSAVLSTKLVMDVMAAGEELDAVVLNAMLTEELMGRLMEITFVSGLVTLLLFWLIFVIRRKKFAGEVCLRPIPVKGILPIAIMAAGFNIVTTVVISFIPWPAGWMESYVDNSSAIDGSLMAWLAAVVMAPVLEEIVFRGLMYTRLKKGLPAIVAAVIASLAFGVAHGTIIWAIYTFIFSMVLIWVFEKFQSLMACIMLHMVYNLSGMALSLIPDTEAGMILIWVLFAAGIAGVYAAYRMIEKMTAECNLDFQVLS